MSVFCFYQRLFLNMWTWLLISAFVWGQAGSKLAGVHTSILHHDFLQLFIMFLTNIRLCSVILMPFTLSICKIYLKREIAGSWNFGPEKAMSEIPILHISKWAEILRRNILEHTLQESGTFPSAMANNKGMTSGRQRPLLSASRRQQVQLNRLR